MEAAEMAKEGLEQREGSFDEGMEEEGEADEKEVDEQEVDEEGESEPGGWKSVPCLIDFSEEDVRVRIQELVDLEIRSGDLNDVTIYSAENFPQLTNDYLKT